MLEGTRGDLGFPSCECLGRLCRRSCMKILSVFQPDLLACCWPVFERNASADGQENCEPERVRSSVTLYSHVYAPHLDTIKAFADEFRTA